MERLKKIKHLVFKEDIPSSVTPGVGIHHPLEIIEGTCWSVDIVITRDNPCKTKFFLLEKLQDISIQVRLSGFGLKGKVFAFGNIYFAVDVLPMLDITICNKQFHHLFEEIHNIETRIDCTTKKIDPTTVGYLKNRNYLHVGGEVTFYSIEENFSRNESTNSADQEAHIFLQSSRFKPFSDLSKDIRSMFIDSIITDTELICGLETFHVHKAILAGRSPVFHAMFHNPMRENTENKVVVKDMEPQTIKAMLEYIYSGHITELSNPSTCELLSAADRYELPGLKDICVDFLNTNVNVNNVLRVFVYADLYDELLKKRAMEYICKHYEYLKSTPEWLILKSERSDLIMEVMDFNIQLLKSN